MAGQETNLAAAPAQSSRRWRWLILAVAVVLLLILILLAGQDPAIQRGLTRVVGRVVKTANRKLPYLLAFVAFAAVGIWSFIGGCCLLEWRKETRKHAD